MNSISYAAAAARTLVGAVFLVSGLHKLAAPVEEFAVVIEAYRLISPGMSLKAAHLLPWLEVFLGFLLVSGFQVRAASAAGGAFFTLFIAALGSTVLRGIELANCGCFGGGIHLTPHQAMTLDSVLLGLSYFAYKKGAAFAPVECWIVRARKEHAHGG